MNILDKLKDLTKGLLSGPKSGQNGNEKEETSFQNMVKWFYKLRGVFMAVPVAVTAVILAFFNALRLPETIMIHVPSFAEDEVIVKLLELDKGTAIFAPLLITAVCLLLMFCSRRQVYPWLISVFTLVVPVFLLFVSVFPG